MCVLGLHFNSVLYMGVKKLIFSLCFINILEQSCPCQGRGWFCHCRELFLSERLGSQLNLCFPFLITKMHKAYENFPSNSLRLKLEYPHIMLPLTDNILVSYFYAHNVTNYFLYLQWIIFSWLKKILSKLSLSQDHSIYYFLDWTLFLTSPSAKVTYLKICYCSANYNILKSKMMV